MTSTITTLPGPTRLRLTGIAGSPFARSRSSWLLELAQTHLRRAGAVGTSVHVRELPAIPLLAAEGTHVQLRDAIAQVLVADVVLVSTPIYKAAYSGLLKLFLDLLPMEALRGKTVLPIATGGSAAHLLALDYALKPVLSALGAREVLAGVFTTDRELAAHDTLGFVPDADLVARLDRSLQPLLDRIAIDAGAMPALARCS